MRLALLLLISATALGAADLALPPLTEQGPQPGKRATVITPEYAGTKVHHQIALPDDWTPDWKARGKRWPVIAEYTGNYFPTSGSTGEIEGAGLGYGVARGAEMLTLMFGFGIVSRLATGWIADRIGGLYTLLLGSPS